MSLHVRFEVPFLREGLPAQQAREAVIFIMRAQMSLHVALLREAFSCNSIRRKNTTSQSVEQQKLATFFFI